MKTNWLDFSKRHKLKIDQITLFKIRAHRIPGALIFIMNPKEMPSTQLQIAHFLILVQSCERQG